MNYLESECNCFKNRVECGETCGCSPENCSNRQMSLKQSLKLGEDVEERTAWGIDVCTAFNIHDVLPINIPHLKKSEFIE